jgi:hypothetical protein
MGKGKGRASAKATFRYDIQQNAREVIQQHHYNSNLNRQSSLISNAERPRFVKTSLGQLRNLLRERRSHENFEWMQQRRRNGFLPQNRQTTTITGKTLASVSLRPLGSLLFASTTANDNLQTKCVQVLGEYLSDYKEAMGKEELHAALSLLDSESLALLSVAVSKTKKGVDDDISFCLGKHSHVQALCFRARKSNSDDASYFSDQALLDLIPTSHHFDPSSSFRNSYTISKETISWEDLEDDQDGMDSILKSDDTSSSYRLKRLELVDCPSLTSNALRQFLELSPFITHLSLAGCLNSEGDGGTKLLEDLPSLLPGLKVLDLTKCSWVTDALIINQLKQKYSNSQQTPPKVYHKNFPMREGKNEHYANAFVW